jgi:gamma-glutamylcyclotransferase (GGCT)/AIG2-like uncharacterized protein YtfP
VTTEGPVLLYFAYTARIEPSKMAEVSPGAAFEFIAHLADWSLDFPINGNGWKGGLPSVSPNEGDTVWGAVYAVPERDAAALDAIESEESRRRRVVEAIDRTGHRHQVTTYVADENGTKPRRPASEYVELMVAGSKHWELPAGWIIRLQDHLDR